MNKPNFKTLMSQGIVLMDGAMGTYYASKQNDYTNLCEKANLTQPDVIRQIHLEYLEAGSKVITTNTFSANPYDLNCSFEEVQQILETGYQIATDVTQGTDTLVASSIGPISETSETTQEEVLSEYYKILDVFLNCGANLFLFETFSDTEYIPLFVEFIKSRNDQAEIIAGFSINLHGYSKKGISIKKMIEDLSTIEGLTAIGFNCGVGAGHLHNLLKTVATDKYPILAMPNAGYPEKIYDRTLYIDNADYFAETMMEICELGVSVIGGCCGTTPKHIKRIAESLAKLGPIEIHKKELAKAHKAVVPKVSNTFYDKLSRDEFVIAVEIDPPFGYDVTKLMEAAHLLKAANVDILTIADSPLGKVRLDSLMMSAKIHREVGIDVMPHVCCRDKNTIALKALISAAYVEGIRNYLLVTGDPLPDVSRGDAKAVFHMNSVKLMSFVNEMNAEVMGDEFVFGGALNPKLPNIDKIIERVRKKQEAGAKFLLTQPIYTEQEIQNIVEIKKRTGIKVLGGILPLVSYRNARFINNEFAGMNIPEEVIHKFHPDMSREEAEAVGVECAVSVAKAMKTAVDGLYFMTPFNRATMITKILKQI